MCRVSFRNAEKAEMFQMRKLLEERNMDERSLCNKTYARSGSLMDTTFFTLNCTILTFTLVLGLPGNLWVCWVVFRTKSLRTFNNALLVNLAASDLLKCAVDTPLLLFSFLRRVSVPVCTLQQFTYALCSCVQLLTLVSISVERFQAIAFPFQTQRRKARVRLWILSIWVCGLILAVVSLTLSKKALFYMLCRPHVGVHSQERLRGVDPFGPYVLVPVWGLSLTVIVIHYMRIFQVVRQHRRKVVSRGVDPRPKVSADIWGLLGDSAPEPRTAPPDSFTCQPAAGTGAPLPPRRTVFLLAGADTPCAGSSTRGAPRRRPDIVGAVCFLTPGAKERGKKHAEGKVAQRFGYIIVAFTLSWVPMVVVLLLNVIWWEHRNKVSIISPTISARLLMTFK